MDERRARRVVMTRLPAQAGDLEAGLLAAGHDVRFLPLTDFELPADSGPLDEAVRRLAAGEFAWLVITSPNTVRALVRSGWDGSLPPTTRVAVTGPGTARVLADAGCPVPPWMPDGDASAAGIVAAFPSAHGTGRTSGDGTTRTPGDETGRTSADETGRTPVDGTTRTPSRDPERPAADGTTPERPPAEGGAASSVRRVLLPQSALATDEVAEGLTTRGWTVQRIEAYRTVPYPGAAGRRLLSGGAVGEAAGEEVPVIAGQAPGTSGSGPVVDVGDLRGAAVVLTSPSAVHELVRRLGARRPEDTAFIAIGRPTERAARENGLELAGTASSPDAPGVLEVLASLPAERP